MIFRRRVGSKGQVVIPKDVREHLGVKSDSKVVFEVSGNSVILRADMEPEQWVEEFVSVGKKKLRREVDIEKIIEEEVSEELDLHRQ